MVTLSNQDSRARVIDLANPLTTSDPNFPETAPEEPVWESRELAALDDNEDEPYKDYLTDDDDEDDLDDDEDFDEEELEDEDDEFEDDEFDDEFDDDDDFDDEFDDDDDDDDDDEFDDDDDF